MACKVSEKRMHHRQPHNIKKGVKNEEQKTELVLCYQPQIPNNQYPISTQILNGGKKIFVITVAPPKKKLYLSRW